MALEDLTPAVRVEGILDGADIEPATRLEYFLSKAANEVPKPAGVSDAGKVLTVNEDGDGFILDEVDPGLPDISGVSDAGKVVTVNPAGNGYELDDVPEANTIVTFSTETTNAIMQAMQSAIPTAVGGSVAMFVADLTSAITDAERTTVKTACANAIELGKGSLVSFAGGVATPTSYASVTASNISFLIPNYALPYSGVTYTLRLTLSIQVHNSNNDAAAVGFLEKIYQSAS